MYTLTLTEAQARVLSSACELLSRIGMGQIEECAEYIPEEQIRKPDRLELKQALENLTPLATGLSRGAYHSIAAAGWMARTAYDLHQVLRHRLAWDREPAGGIFVRFDEPHRLGPEPLPTISRVKDDTVQTESLKGGALRLDR